MDLDNYCGAASAAGALGAGRVVEGVKRMYIGR